MAKTPVRKKQLSNKKDVTNKKESAPSIKTAASNKDARILAEEVLSHDGKHKIGIMTLNSAKTMNAVDLEMVNLIDDVLAKWQDDDDIVAMVMHGAGDKAFCAGGDIRKLYDSMVIEGDDHLNYADDFFTAEYGKNYRVHRFGKPIIAWGHGFVMGGGLGLFIGSSHKVGTETLKLAWPEIRIGLFPDVAGSYYLSRLPFPLGHWMALTGSQMNAVDCKHAGLINYCLGNSDLPKVIEQLRHQPWQSNKAMNNQYVRDLLTSIEQQSDTSFPPSNYADNKADIESLFAAASGSTHKLQNHVVSINDNKLLLEKVAENFAKSESENPWFIQGRDNFYGGCPGTAHLIMQQLLLGPNMTLKDVVQWELILALQSVRHPDFAEGIRAMVVDKDFTPHWQHKSVADVPLEWIEGLMKPLWPEGEHPFKAL
ncbi:MAG: enoyl-CoA hydratase/isomerase family protein [Oleispira sp.]|nr:enoyl-CoA hydratase/isomerase family protein [Oleispira sp.]